MNRNDIKQRIKGLNEYMLSESTKQLLLLTLSSDYTYNKAIAIVNKNTNKTDWYSIDDKNCFRTWNEVEAFIDGICRSKNTNFYDEHER